MRLKFESDLHIDFKHNYIPNLNNISCYCIAGDLGEVNKYCLIENWIKDLLKKYPYVKLLLVDGNHSFYSGNKKYYMEKVQKIMTELDSQLSNFHYLNNSSVVINNIRFIGSTFWTSFNNSNPTDMYLANTYMNDYKKIRYANGQLRFTPEYSVRLHKIAKEYIFKTLEESKEKCVVITHHMPIIKPYNELDAAYGTELRNEIAELKNKPIIWAYGHQHKFADEIFNFLNGEIRFISNPHGYPFEETGFKKDFIIEI